MRTPPFIFPTVIAASLQADTMAATSKSEVVALFDFYDALSGDSWRQSSGWASDSDPCNYTRANDTSSCTSTCKGLTCDDWVGSSDHTCLELEHEFGCDCSGCGCGGSWDGVLCERNSSSNESHVVVLSLPTNNLAGSLPASLAQLPYLRGWLSSIPAGRGLMLDQTAEWTPIWKVVQDLITLLSLS